MTETRKRPLKSRKKVVKHCKKKPRKVGARVRKALTIAQYRDRHLKVIRIAIMVTEFGPYQEELLKGYKEAMSEIIPQDVQVIYKEFCSEGAYKELVMDNARRIIEGCFDLIYAIGNQQITYLKVVRDMLGDKTPAMFAGVSDAIKRGFIKSYKKSYNNIFGVTVLPPCNILPAQLIMVFCPTVRDFFMPYRRDSIQGALESELDKMCAYFEKNGRKIIRYPYEGTPEVEAYAEMKKYQAVIIPEGGMTYTERDMFLQAINSFQDQGFDIVAFADGKDAVEKGAIFGLRSDIYYIGELNAHQTKKVFIDGIKPNKIETVRFNNSRSLVFDTRKAKSKYGVVFTRDFLTLLYDAVQTNQSIPNFFILLKIFTVYCETNSPLLREALAKLTAKVKTRLATVTGKTYPIDMSGVPENTPMADCIARAISADHTKGLYVGGGRAVKVAAENIAQSGKPIFLESVQVANSLEEAQGLDIEMPLGAVHHARVFEPINPTAIVDTMKSCVERCDWIYTIVGLPEDRMPQGTEAYLARMEQEAAILGVKNKAFVSTDFDEIMAFIRKKSKDRRGKITTRKLFCSIPHLVDTDLLESVLDACREEGIMFAAPSLVYKGRAPIAFGLRAGAMQAHLADEKEPSEGYHTDFIKSGFAYTFHISSKLVSAWGGRVSQRRIKLLGYTCQVDGAVVNGQ